LPPAAVALVHGLRGEDAARNDWLTALARVRGVPPSLATRGTGYGELFDALVHLHYARPLDALDVLGRFIRQPPEGLYSFVFHQWIVAVHAEAAVLAGTPRRRQRAGPRPRDHPRQPVATAITARTSALLHDRRDLLTDAATNLRHAGAPYPADRTEHLATAPR